MTLTSSFAKLLQNWYDQSFGREIERQCDLWELYRRRDNEEKTLQHQWIDEPVKYNDIYSQVIILLYTWQTLLLTFLNTFM